GVNNNTCEVYLLDLSIEKPTREDLVRLTAVPSGSEVTGAMPTSDNKSLLLNVQHPSITNPFPYNHSLTFAINGFDRLKVTDLKEPELNKTGGFQVYPNPTTRMVYLNQTTDVAIYNVDGKRMRTLRNTSEVNVSDLKPGVYFLQNATGDVQKLIIQ
ncbi:MAG: T9SS type A sorting domain-containing protein, partial [Haliscomenobacter sp.]|nr:T9SS type A sorting domain-containing protein [Haliscomenobacter sp.]